MTRASRWLAVLLGGTAGGRGADRGVARGVCNIRFKPPEPGNNALSLNGVQLPDTCFHSNGEHQVFIIGDWGGVASGDPEIGPVTADHRKSGWHKRDFVEGLDDCAQYTVRDTIRERAATERPDYILNVGDNFYWGGVEARCGTTRHDMSNFSSQWDDIFENMYTGEGLDGLQWLGVLGNHDYGGFLYSNGWDQTIMYTWKQPGHGKKMRWVTPALYWRSTVHYDNFSVDYFFIDTNVYDAEDPFLDMANNICSYAYNPSENGSGDCSCEGGPEDVHDCYRWFTQLWEEQLDWLELHLSNSSADWQIVVTHFPPSFDKELFGNLSADYGIDLFVTGHLHRQEVHGDDESNFLAPTVWVVSGGGGGITSDYMPDKDGDSQYGFMRMTLASDRLEVVNVEHTGLDGDRVVVSQRNCSNCTEDDVTRNFKRYKQGLRRRGRVGASRTKTSTTVSTTISTTISTTMSTVSSATSTLASTGTMTSASVDFSSAVLTLDTTEEPEAEPEDATPEDATLYVRRASAENLSASSRGSELPAASTLLGGACLKSSLLAGVACAATISVLILLVLTRLCDRVASDSCGQRDGLAGADPRRLIPAESEDMTWHDPERECTSCSS